MRDVPEKELGLVWDGCAWRMGYTLFGVMLCLRFLIEEHPWVILVWGGVWRWWCIDTGLAVFR